MPDEIIIGTDVKAVLGRLENYGSKNHLSRTQDYTKIISALEEDVNLNLTEIERLLEVCIHDIKEDMRYTASIMKIINVIASRVQKGMYDPCPDLLPSALAVLHVLKTTAPMKYLDALKQLCFDTLSAYPNAILIAALEDYEEIMEVCSLYCHVKTSVTLRMQICLLMHRILKILQPEKRKQLVNKELSLWFSNIIPTCMHLDIIENENIVELLEILAEELANVDYTDNQHWQNILKSICTTHKYPAIMKALLHKGSKVWHRIWIIFIRLLKHQVTQVLGSIGTPINSMLPVVESAFKVDVMNRCNAFECWMVLIDSFSTETNQSNINKRLKLLLIPLKSNNAKAEATALAKFKCWWHLIVKFQNKIDQFIDIILVSFLHFCFGKHDSTDTVALVPGQISIAVKKQCIQALVEIVGHVDCDGCTELPKISGKLINTKNLVFNWNHWVYSLSSTIMMSATTDNGLTKQQMTCLWKSYIRTIGELPENNIRKDLFSEMLSIISVLVKKCTSDAVLSEIVLEALILSLFDGDIRIKQLLKTKLSDTNRPLFKVILSIVDPALHLAYQSCSFKEMVAKLRLVTDMLFDPVYSSPTFAANFVLQNLTATDMSLCLWTALAESMIECASYVTCENLMRQTILWPLQLVKSFSKVRVAALTWCALYDLCRPKLKQCEEFEKAMSKFLFTVTEITHSTIYFKLCVVLSILKHKIAEQNPSSAYEKELELLHIMTGRIDSYHNYEKLFPILVDRTIAAATIIVENINENAARYILFCMKKIVKVMTLTCKQLTDDPLILSFIDTLLKSIDSLIHVEEYQRFIPVIVDEIIECSSFLSQQSITKNTVHSVMRTLQSKIVDENDSSFKKIKAVIDNIENEAMAMEENQSSNKNKFITPKTKEVPKRIKKKEASIINTVIENGEEYVVVKSNWKFNPRKLTENQKEKLQRKREDIPALYQDLSQSQDECKLVSWKTDSQDASDSSKSESKTSKSGNNESNLEIILNQSGSNVVPKILETFTNSLKKDSPTITKVVLPTDNKPIKPEAVTPKNTKSPRMALKDRVIRNYKNLIENSAIQKKSATVDLNLTETIIKTPKQSTSDDSANIDNSEPPLLEADRPSRVKRKPKKFDELHMLMRAKKGSQLSKSQNQSNQSDINTTPVTTVSAVDTIHSVDTGCDEVEMTEDNDLQVPEKITDASDKSEIEPAKEEHDIEMEDEKSSEEMNEIPKELNVDRPNENKVDSCSDRNFESSCGEKIRSSSEKKVESSIEKEVENSIEEEAENCIENEVECSTENKVKSLTKNEVKSSTELQVENQTEKEIEISIENIVEISTEVQAESSTEKQLESSNDNKNEVSKNKKDDMTDDTKNKGKNSNNESNKSNDIQNHITTNDEDKNTSKESTDEVEVTSINGYYANSTITQNNPCIKEVKAPSTPQQESKTKDYNTEEQKSTTKMTNKKLRIEKELAIDMVEGHPFLKMQSPKRLTRKALESAGTDRRKSLLEKLDKSKSATKNSDKKKREKNKDSDCSSSNSSVTVEESQVQDTEKNQTSFTEDLPYSEDFIESSQESSITTISVKSTKKVKPKVPFVSLTKIKIPSHYPDKSNDSQSILLDCVMGGVSESAKSNQVSNDSELPLNKTATEQSETNLTENMDTEPMEDLSEVFVIINDDVPAPLTISSDETEVGLETQEIAEADTQPTDPKNFMEVDVVHKNTDTSLTVFNLTKDEIREIIHKEDISIKGKPTNPPEDMTITLSDSAVVELEKESGSSSPSSFGDEAKRKQDFLNNTLEISPIKNMSPERHKKSPSPETSSDYVVITLSSPVNSNGEPLEKCGSPEVFTEDKVSPDKRDQSPPRVEVTVTNTSPSSSLSLKKNRPQVRAGGRAAQMLGLCCIPDTGQTITNQEKSETEETKKTNSSSTHARRNLRILYNSVSENIEPPSENEESEHFLKFRRSLPAIDSSPAGPILKRKLIEIADDATISPASKRKRVSFHDPPVSTTVSVQKYIEPGGVRSPQNSVHKRLERQMRQKEKHTPVKSPKRLAFKLDTVLNRAVESFTETSITSVSSTDDTQPVSLDETPVVEIVRASELNDIDPICPELIDCNDPIDNIAGELSSCAMKSLLVKELVGKVDTVGDLAKMTELEVNRLCIKAPKVKVAKKVLTEYAANCIEKPFHIVSVTIDEAVFDEPMTDPDLTSSIDNATQTVTNVYVDTEAQTVAAPMTASFVQTDTTPIVHTVVQTDESGSKSTADIVKSCLSERPDFVEQVGEHLEDTSLQKITDKLPFSAITDVLIKKMTPTDAKTLLNRVLENQWNNTPEEQHSSKELSFIRKYMCDRFNSKELILFCSEVLKSVYEKP